MRVVEFHRYLNEDNALRVHFELEYGDGPQICRSIGVPVWPIQRIYASRAIRYRTWLRPL